MGFRVGGTFFLISTIFFGCATLSDSEFHYYIRNRSVLPVEFKLNGSQYNLEPGGITPLEEVPTLSDVSFEVNLTKNATYQIASPSGQKLDLKYADSMISKKGSMEKRNSDIENYYFDLWLPGQVSVEKTNKEAPLPGESEERLRFIRKAVQLISLRNGIENSKNNTMALESMIIPLNNYALLGFSEDPWEKELRKAFWHIEDQLWLALAEDALKIDKYEEAVSYILRYEETKEQRPEEENSFHQENLSKYKDLSETLETIADRRRHRIVDYNKALAAVFRNFRIAAETQVWEYEKQYKSIAPYESIFLNEVLNDRKKRMPWFRFGIGLGVANNFYLLFGPLADDSQNLNQLGYHQQGPSLSLRFDFRLDNILLGINAFGEARFSSLMNGAVYGYYDNKNLVTNTGESIRALNKVRYSPSTFSGFTTGLTLSFEPRIRNQTIILRTGMGYDYAFVDDFEVFHEVAGTWNSYAIDVIKTLSVNGHLGYGLFINDLNKLEFFYGISAIIPMEPFSTELPLWSELVQTRHSIQFSYVVFF